MDKLGIGLKPKTANVLATEGVAIADFTADKQRFSVIHDPVVFLGRETPVATSAYPENPLFRGINDEPLAVILRYWRWVAYGNMLKATELISWSLAEIFDVKRNDGCLPKASVGNGGLYDSNIGPQLASRGFIGCTNEVASGYPKEDGRKGQYNGESYKRFVFPVVEKVSEAIPIKVGAHNESEEIIFRLVVGGLFIAMLYAGLKR